MKKILILILSVFMIFSVLGCSNNSDNESQEKDNNVAEVEEESQGDYLVVSAPELYQAYAEDPESADEKYKGKNLAIEGEIANTGVLGEDYIVNLLVEEDVREFVQCLLSDPVDIERAKELDIGDTVTILGEVNEKGNSYLDIANSTLK